MILKFILNVVKSVFTEESKESKPQEEKLKPEKTQAKKTTIISQYKVGEYYVVNVCAVYLLSGRKILFTGSSEKLLNETKKLKYRPFVITKVNTGQISVIALSTDKKRKKSFLIFDAKNKCKFIETNCFLPKSKKNQDVYIFSIEKRIKRKNGKKKIKRKFEFQIPISVLDDLKDIKNAKLRKETQDICEIGTKKVLLKKCADCDEEYLSKIVNNLEKYKTGE